jgi:hypothetical protein
VPHAPHHKEPKPNSAAARAAAAAAAAAELARRGALPTVPCSIHCFLHQVYTLTRIASIKFFLHDDG